MESLGIDAIKYYRIAHIINRTQRRAGRGQMKQNMRPRLVGDIGGTNVRFAIAVPDAQNKIKLTHFRSLAAVNFKTFAESLDAYFQNLEKADRPKTGVFAIAGPIDATEVRLTNRDWVIQKSEITQKFGFDETHYVNDFSAMARAVPELGAEDFSVLNAGAALTSKTAQAPISITGAGTGLGQSILFQGTSHDWSVIPTEGGHQGFTPYNNFEIDILRILLEQNDFITSESICSGRGLENVYTAILTRAGKSTKAVDISHRFPAAHITKLASEQDLDATAACQFVGQAITSFAGNAVLSSGAWQGAVIGGGVSKHLRPYIERPEAIERFYLKGKMTERMKAVSARLILNDKAPLYGAAFCKEPT